MPAYLICITVSGGVPLFTRKHGDLKAIPYPLLASLNGVAMFGLSHDVTLISTVTRDCKIIWRDYHNSVRLILAVPNDSASDLHVHRLMDLVFQAMVLMVGLDDLVSQRNLDRTKRDLRASFCLVDSLLATLNPTEKLSTFGDLVGALDCVVFPEAQVLQSFLESFVDQVDSTYGCVFLHGRLACATKNWWSLHPDEATLLALYVGVDAWATMRDTPVFLPVKSPTVPFRLVSCELIFGVTLCVLCGPSPTLPEIEAQVHKTWRTSYGLLASLLSVHPRGFPPVQQMDPSILGFILVNLEKRRVLSSIHPSPQPPGAPGAPGAPGGALSSPHRQLISPSRRLDILRSFYRTVVGPVFADAFVPTPHGMNQNGEFLSSHAPHLKPLHPVSETYLSSEYHKCLAVQHQQYQLFLVFIAAVPNHSMRGIAHRTLQMFLKDKQFSIVK